MYRPKPFTGQPPEKISGWATSLVNWLFNELVAIGRASLSERDYVTYKLLFKTPDRVTACMTVYFDATAPEATAGEGLYRRNAANAAWVFVG